MWQNFTTNLVMDEMIRKPSSNVTFIVFTDLMTTAIVPHSQSLTVIITSSLLIVVALSVANSAAVHARDEDNSTTVKASRYDQSGKSSYYQNYAYETMKDYFLELKRAIYVRLQKAQPNTVDDTPEFQPWIL
ncbi:unnamed protein product [Litomosoides sigmodontis]|uniref:Uncharacterized protein n=1 Tax=Litomosoides sigmodontis TaxID=42156 RepID=A0A3P6SS17_LITSI|nr:unnamed protein product [Litomosoides sigmodontis]